MTYQSLKLHIVSEDLKIDNAKVVKAIRLGAHKGNRPRLLLITMDHERSKWRILSQSTKLLNYELVENGKRSIFAQSYHQEERIE